MNAKRLLNFACFATAALMPLASYANLSGTYKSENNCMLTVSELDAESGYADAVYLLRSDGEAACEWSGAGVGKRTIIEAGMVSGSTSAFVEANWKFGPAGDLVEVTYYGSDGEVRNKESFNRQGE